MACSDRKSLNVSEEDNHTAVQVQIIFAFCVEEECWLLATDLCQNIVEIKPLKRFNRASPSIPEYDAHIL